MTESREAGWYPDPNDESQMIYWTGTSWDGERAETDADRSSAVATPAEASRNESSVARETPPPPPPPPGAMVMPSAEGEEPVGAKKTPLWRSTWVLVGAGVVVVIAVVAILVFAGTSTAPTSSAQAVSAAATADVQTGNWAGLCSLVEPSERAQCSSHVSAIVTGMKAHYGSASFPEVSLAYVTTSGGTGVAVLKCSHTSKYCTDTTGASNGQQLIRVNGQWYLTLGSSSNGSSGASGSTGASGSSGATGTSGTGGSTGSSG